MILTNYECLEYTRWLKRMGLDSHTAPRIEEEITIAGDAPEPTESEWFDADPGIIALCTLEEQESGRNW